MSVCPLDFRYGHPAMKAIFSDENKLRTLLEAEAALARAHARLGTVPKAAADEIAVTDSIPVPEEALGMVKVLPSGALLGEAILRIHSSESVSSLFVD